MPIHIDEFEGDDVPGEPSVPEQIVSYLTANDERAFTRSEIANAIEADPNAVGTALSRLKDRQLVRHRGRYWAVTDDRDRLAASYDLHVATGSLNDRDGGIDADAWDESAPDASHPSERDGSGV